MTQQFCEELTGLTVCGGYSLGEMIGATEHSAVYLTSHAGAPAAIKLWHRDESPPEVACAESEHLLRTLAAGTCEANGSVFPYVVTEVADENLASVVAARKLSVEETLEMLEPVLEGLAYLHDHGLVHANLKPSNILAKGDSIKLSVDSVRPAVAYASPEDDMRALGLTIVEVLTQQRAALAIDQVPKPLRDIVEHTLTSDPLQRWSARQTLMRLLGTVPSAPPATARARKGLLPFWLLPAAGGVMLAAVIFVVMRGSAPLPAAKQQVPPRLVVPKPTPFEAPAKPVPAAAPQRQGWYVVVASYSRQADAAQEAASLAKRFPQFKLSVFPPSPIDTHYLVIIGAGLSEAGADSLRQRAVASGLPRDTYIKMYPKEK